MMSYSNFFIILFVFSLIYVLKAYAQDIRDIKPPVDLPTNYIFWIIALGIIVLVLIIIFFYLNRSKFFVRKIEPQVIQPPWEITLERLNVLEQKNFIQKNQLKEYFTELSDIIRRYMEDRFQINAPEMTTFEFLASLKDSSLLTSEQKNLLKDILDSCDLVKFAQYGPPLDMAQSFYLAAKTFVEETTPETTIQIEK